MLKFKGFFYQAMKTEGIFGRLFNDGLDNYIFSSSTVVCFVLMPSTYFAHKQ